MGRAGGGLLGEGEGQPADGGAASALLCGFRHAPGPVPGPVVKGTHRASCQVRGPIQWPRDRSWHLVSAQCTLLSFVSPPSMSGTDSHAVWQKTSDTGRFFEGSMRTPGGGPPVHQRLPPCWKGLLPEAEPTRPEPARALGCRWGAGERADVTTHCLELCGLEGGSLHHRLGAGRRLEPSRSCGDQGGPGFCRGEAAGTNMAAFPGLLWVSSSSLGSGVSRDVADRQPPAMCSHPNP